MNSLKYILFAFILIFACPMALGLNLSDSLLAWYPLDNNASDMSGNGHHGSVSGATNVNYGYISGSGSYSFDGGDEIDTSLNGNNINFPLTVSLWFRVNDTTPWPDRDHILFSDGVMKYTFEPGESDLDVNTWASGGGASSNINVSYTAWNNSHWYNLVAVFPGNNMNGFIYLDNVLRGEGNVRDSSENNDVNLGNIVNGLLGYIDEVRFYTKNFTQSMVTDLYRCQQTTNFTITSTIDSFSIDINGSGYNKAFTTSIGYIETGLLSNDTGLYNISVYVEGYYDVTFTNYNVSLNGSCFSMPLSEAVVGSALYSNYITVNGIDYSRTLNYSLNFTQCPGNYTAKRYIDGVNDLNHSVNCTTDYLLNSTYHHSSDGEFNISWTFIWDGVNESDNYTITDTFVSDITAPSISYLHYNVSGGFNNDKITLNITCTDASMHNLSYNLTFNDVLMFLGNLSNGTMHTNTSTLNQSGNLLEGACSDHFSTTRLNYSATLYYAEIWLIDELENTAFDVSNLSVVKIYQDDNSSVYDFKGAGKTQVNFTSTENSNLRLELITVNGDTVIRYIDITLINDTIRLCANKDDVLHYEQLIISSQVKPVILESVYANCLITADYTRFGYQNAYALKAYSINTMYYLYTFDDGHQINLASIDGSIQSYINIDTLEFQREGYDISILQDGLGFQKQAGSIMAIYYENQADDNTALRLAIKRLDTNVVLVNTSNFNDTNEFTMYFNYGVYSNVTNQTMFQVFVTKTNKQGTETIKRYFNIAGSSGLINAGLAVAIALFLTIFGLTFTVSRDTFGWFGIFIVGGAIAVLSFATSAWYVTFMLVIEIILMVFISIILVTKNYPTIS